MNKHEFNPNREGRCKYISGSAICGLPESATIHMNVELPLSMEELLLAHKPDVDTYNTEVICCSCGKVFYEKNIKSWQEWAEHVVEKSLVKW